MYLRYLDEFLVDPEPYLTEVLNDLFPETDHRCELVRTRLKNAMPKEWDNVSASAYVMLIQNQYSKFLTDLSETSQKGVGLSCPSKRELADGIHFELDQASSELKAFINVLENDLEGKSVRFQSGLRSSRAREDV